MKPRVVKTFWKIRDKRTGFFVMKSGAAYHWWSGTFRGKYSGETDEDYQARKTVFEEEQRKWREKEEAKDNYCRYAELGIVGKTYSTKAGAIRMAYQLGVTVLHTGAGRTVPKEQWLPAFNEHFELVEYEVQEVGPVDLSV